MDLLFKVAILILTFTAFDFYVARLADLYLPRDSATGLMVTTLIAAPFGFFVMSIMSVQRRLKERLRVYSCTDQLTGLLNRQAFLNSAQEALASARTCSVLMIDVDHFKTVNDTYGHYVGDICLRRVGDHLRASVRDSDIIGRVGGEEFVVLLPEADVEVADWASARICQPITIHAAQDIDQQIENFDITTSVGGVLALPGQDLTELMRHADKALYDAKEAGRARVVFIDREAA